MIKEIVDKQVYELKKLWTNKRQLAFQLLNLGMIVFSALMIWKGLMFITMVSFAVVDILFIHRSQCIHTHGVSYIYIVRESCCGGVEWFDGAGLSER